MYVAFNLLPEPLFLTGCGARPEARTEAFTAEKADLSDLCALCGKTLETRG
jgi:hypothetical protein